MAGAATVTVLPGNPNWGSIPGENTGGGTAAITATAPRSGNGSLEVTGDRSRFSMGNYYDPSSNLGLLSSFTAFTFDWSIAVGSTNPYNVDYTPAFRLHIWDNGVRSELVWEGAYNGTYGNTTKGQWYTSTVNDGFYKNTDNNPLDTSTIATARTHFGYSSNAYVSAISVAAGSGATSGYRAFADNLTVTKSGVTTTYNFEAQATAVPEVGSTLGLLGLGLAGIAGLRRKFSK